MPTIDKLLEKMEQRNVQQIVIVNDQKMQLFSNGHAADGPIVSLQQLQELLNESVPPSILARLSKGGQCRFPYPSPQGLFNITCERRNETLKVSIMAAPPSIQPQAHSSMGSGVSSLAPGQQPSPQPATPTTPIAPTAANPTSSVRQDPQLINTRRWFGLAGTIAVLIVIVVTGIALRTTNNASSSQTASQSEAPKATSTVNANANNPASQTGQPSQAQSQPIEPQAQITASGQMLMTPDEEEFFAAFERASKYLQGGEEADLKDATARANMRADLDQAMVELDSEMMSPRLAQLGMTGVMSLTREAILEMRFCLSMIDGALDSSGEVQDVAALDEAIKHAEKSRDLVRSAAQRVRDIRNKLAS